MSRTLSCMMLPWAIFNGLLPRDRPFSREEQLHILGACIRPSARMSAYPFLDSVSAWFERGQKPKALPRLETDYLDLFVSGGNQYNFWMWCLLLIPIYWNICSKKKSRSFWSRIFNDFFVLSLCIKSAPNFPASPSAHANFWFGAEY